MSRFALKNVSLILMLVAFPLISIGTTGDRPVLWWLGVASLIAGALIPPIMRYLPDPDTTEEPGKHATDLGESRRVC